MGALLAIAAGSGILGLLFLANGVRGLGQARFAAGGGSTLGGGLLVSLGAVAGLFGLNLNSYERLTYEQPVATVSFQAAGAPRAYSATLLEPDGANETYALTGDAWQIDARVLKFHSWATLAGVDAMYRLDRLSGRYDAVADELSETRSVHALSDNPGIDLWRLANQQGANLKAIDASYGSAAYVPMADGAIYDVTLTQSGLVIRAVNPAAERAVETWR